MSLNKPNEIQPLGGRYDGYLMSEDYNGDITIYRHNYEPIGTTSTWTGAVELMENDE